MAEGRVIGGWRRVGTRAWRFPLLCGVGMVILQTGLAIYRFGETSSLLQWLNPLMWVGLGLFFVTGGLIGLVIERLLRGTTGRFRTLLLAATILATPVAIGASLVGGLFGPPRGPDLWPDSLPAPGGDSQTDWQGMGGVDQAWRLNLPPPLDEAEECRTVPFRTLSGGAPCSQALGA